MTKFEDLQTVQFNTTTITIITIITINLLTDYSLYY